MKKYMLFFSILTWMFPGYSLLAQNGKPIFTSNTRIQELKIGDVVPDIEFKLINYSNSKVKLSDFTGKWVVLDFWATWCASCIVNFPRLDTLQNIYKNKLQIILVNSINNSRDNQFKVINFFKKQNEKGISYNLLTAVEDSMASQLFPHNTVPHYVWISPDGKLIATTSSKTVNQANIQKIFSNSQLRMEQKRDFFPNKLPDFTNTRVDEIEYYSFFKKGNLDGQKKVNSLRNVRDKSGLEINRGSFMSNVSILEMYETIMSFMPQFNSSYNTKRRILNIKDYSNLIFDSIAMDKRSWEKSNLYTFDIVLPISDSKSLFQHMLAELNRFSQYQGRIEKRSVKYLAIVDLDHPKKLLKKNDEKKVDVRVINGRYFLGNVSIKTFIEELNKNTPTLILDETDPKSRKRVTINFELQDPNFTSIKENLNLFGFDIIEKEELLNMFVLSDK